MYKKINERKKILVSSKEVEIAKENTKFHFCFHKDEKPYIMAYVAFCPYCKKMELIHKFFIPIKGKEKEIERMQNKDEYFFFNRDFEHRKSKYFYEKIHKKLYSPNCFIAKCPNCGHDLSRNPVEEIFISDKEKRNAKLFGYDVYEKDEKIIIRGGFKYLTPNTYLEKIFISFFDIYISMNLKTGQTFIMAPLKNGKTVKWMKRKILNITYSTFFMSFQHLYCQIFENKKIIKDIAEILKKEKNIEIDDDINFRELVLLNRFPFFDLNFVRNLRPYLEYWQSNRFVRKLCGNIKINERYDINDTIKRFKIPNKPKIRKLITKDPMNLFYFAIAKRIGFSNYDLLVRIVEGYSPSLKHFPHENSQVPDFVKILIKEKGEVKAFSCIFSFYDYEDDDISFLMDYGAIFRYIRDVANMYNILNAAGINTNLSGNIIDIHDRFSKEVKKVKTDNLYIKYSEREKLLEDEVDNIKFILPQDTYQLVDVGQTLHICVGSYGEKAVTKRCTIVLMIKNNKYIGCLELLGNKLIQAKAVCNNLLQEKKAESLKVWVEKHKINIDNCYDYTHIKNDNIIYDKNKIYQNKIRYDNF